MNPVRGTLLRWFDSHKRDLPWRRTRDPYRIWLAEVMLQQTRVPVVVPYYDHFLRAFPTVKHLARARRERVLRLWAGLGYYQRARHLHAAAKRIVREHNGRFPRTLEAALGLPGVGAYTARAVLSIAYRKPVAVVDGNVARVLIRVFRLQNADLANRGAFQELADRVVSRRRPGDFNQALMELGSTLCLPRHPRCAVCPLEKLCAARQAGLERTIPRRIVKRARPRVTLSVLVPRRDGRVLLVREPAAAGLFSGLWHFPYTTGNTVRELANKLGATKVHQIDTLEHEMTARRLILRVYEGVPSANGVKASALTWRAEGKNEALAPAASRARWARPQQVARLGVGAATRKIAEALESREVRR